MITAKIVKDSCNSFGNRITTMELVFPRFILAELNTHRLFSRNSASSRAIPFEKMVKSIMEKPFIPIAWQKPHSGMQGSEYITDEKEINYCYVHWLETRNYSIQQARNISYYASKQIINRLLEPFMYHKVLLTATEFTNFLELRCPKYYYDLEDKYFKSKKEWLKYYKIHCIGDEESDFNLTDLEWLRINKGQSEIHMMALAEAMYDALNESTPKLLKEGEYHIPYKEQIREKLFNLNKKISPDGYFIASYKNEDVRKISASMCARVSYTTVGEGEKEFNYANNIRLHDSLIASGHMSPMEHIARCMNEDEYIQNIKGFVNYSGCDEYQEDGVVKSYNYYEIDNNNKRETDVKGWCNNFRGFIQYRYLIENKK